MCNVFAAILTLAASHVGLMQPPLENSNIKKGIYPTGLFAYFNCQQLINATLLLLSPKATRSTKGKRDNVPPQEDRNSTIE